MTKTFRVKTCIYCLFFVHVNTCEYMFPLIGSGSFSVWWHVEPQCIVTSRKIKKEVTELYVFFHWIFVKILIFPERVNFYLFHMAATLIEKNHGFITFLLLGIMSFKKKHKNQWILTGEKHSTDSLFFCNAK